MGYLESTIVVYLRKIYYPDGFDFPLQNIGNFIYLVEIGREISTIIMLYVFSVILSNNKKELVAFFCFNFGVWDIFYYVWLKVLLDWPQSLLTWDVLYLIPLPWIAPVLAPILISISLIIAALIILKLKDNFELSKLDWIVEISAGTIIILSFLFQLENLSMHQKPTDFPWWLFGTGLIAGFTWFSYRIIHVNKYHKLK